MTNSDLQFIPVGKARDLTGQTYGRWVVLGRAPNNPSHKGAYWWCQCSCEQKTIKSVRGDQLTRGVSTSCGCYATEVQHEIGKTLALNYGALYDHLNKKDLTGQQFGHLTVLEDSGKRIKAGNGTNVIWKCQCDCGKIIEVTGGHLSSGHTNSCGCKKQSLGEEKIATLLIDNNIPFVNEYVVVECNLSTGGHPRFDFFVDNQYFIEYDGEQHFDYVNRGWNDEEAFKRTLIRDKEKNEWCLTQHIPLIRIPYTHKNNIVLEDLLLETSQFISTQEKDI